MIVWLFLTVTVARNLDTKTLSEAVENFLPDPAVIKMAKNGIGEIASK